MYTPREVAAWLGVAPVTLRKWAMEFRVWLSPSATRVSRGVARRYTDADLSVLSQVRGYLARSFTYCEIQTFLGQKASVAIATTDPHRVLAETPLIPAVSRLPRSDPVQHAADLAEVREGKTHELSSLLD
jgi:DNA-binding transcriptional MerR regulator